MPVRKLQRDDIFF